VTPAPSSGARISAGTAPAGPGAAASALAGPLLAAADALPRMRLAVLPTPLVPAPCLAEALGTGRLLVKRDDLTGFAFGGNKARLLEFLVAGALADGAGTLLTGGAAGSNFCAAAAAAARRAGLRCELVIAGQPGPAGPALALARSWGAAVRWTGTADRDSVDAQLPAAAAELAARGHRPYLIPRGGATALGAVGYALAAAELHEQLAGHSASHGAGRGDVTVVVPTGSGGTLAGLVAGHLLLGRPWTLLGGSASRPPRAAARQVLSLAGQCLRLLGTERAPSPDDVTVADARGPGHGLPSQDGLAAAEQAMRTEGLMLDPVYTAKALALVPRGRDVVFWHTGGVLDAVAAAEEQS
jgi:D-cysteine desulfhydrase